jgi:hypothetical protein
MKTAGRKTASIYHRYNIVNESDLRKAMEKQGTSFGPKTLPDSCLERDCVGGLGANREKYAKRCLSITRKVTEATSED